MEILIVGGIIVALMVFVSTKIKKSAARAYEPENIETEAFSLVKPEGFINPINEDSNYTFEAYSKDFGEDDAHNIRRASVTLSVSIGSDFNEMCKWVKKSFDKIVLEDFQKQGIDNQRILFIEGEKTENKIQSHIYRKIIEDKKNQKIYDLKISILPDFLENYEDEKNEILNSFVVK